MKKLTLLIATIGISFVNCFAEVGIELTPTSLNAGTGGSGVYTTWTSGTGASDGYLSVRNVGTSPMEVKIRATNMYPANWLLGTSAAQNIFTLQWGQTVTLGTEPSWNLVSTTSVKMFNVTNGQATKLDLRFRSPTSIDPITTTQQVSTITFSAAPLALSATTYTYLTKWGSSGSGNDQFTYPYGLTIDAAGTIYVADKGNHRIKKYSPNGTLLNIWGEYGSGDGQLFNPADVAVDTAGYVYVADTNNNRIQKFTSEGVFVTKWGTSGSGDGQFSGPQGIAIDPNGNVYVSDSGNARVQKFSTSGTYVTKWGSSGSGNGQFYNAGHVAVNPDGNVYVIDDGHNRIEYFTSTGTYVGTLSTGFQSYGFAIDEGGSIYVSDLTGRVVKYNSAGTSVAQFGTNGSGNGQFSNPWGVGIDAAGNVYVVDEANYRVQVFAPQY